MPDKYVVTGSSLTSVADAIRAKSGRNEQLTFPAGFVSEIESIVTGQPVYTSSTGLLYTPVMTINIAMERTVNGCYAGDILTRYGQMPNLEELTLTGIARFSSSGAFLANEGAFSQTKFPLLKKLHIVPTEMRTGIGDETDNQYISFSHYVFKDTNLTELTMGKLNGPYFKSGGYFRNDLPNPPTSNKYAVGSVDGLTIKIYVDAYKTPAAGFMSSLAPNTTVIQYDYLTGEILTA